MIFSEASNFVKILRCVQLIVQCMLKQNGAILHYVTVSEYFRWIPGISMQLLATVLKYNNAMWIDC